MTKKPEHVPGMREPRPNRAQRRHPERLEVSRCRGTSRSLTRTAPQDVSDPRAKNSGHKKKTAENWNQ